MLVMLLEKTPPAVRGDLTRWLVEVKTGVYVGHVTAMVRDKLWERCMGNKGVGAVFQAWSTNNEQRYKMRLAGSEEREVVDWEGVELIRQKKDRLTRPQRRRVKPGV